MLHDKTAPYGVWRVSAAFVTAEWDTHQPSTDDFAFVELQPTSPRPTGKTLEDLVGGYVLSRTPTPEQTTVVGYPNGANKPVHCTTLFTTTHGWPTFNCNGYPGGTSGGPWLKAAQTISNGDRVFGIIGGLQQGGCSSATSYSPVFGSNVQGLLADAEADRSPLLALPSSSSGC
jgi:hypothetical protein